MISAISTASMISGEAAAGDRHRCTEVPGREQAGGRREQALLPEGGMWTWKRSGRFRSEAPCGYREFPGCCAALKDRPTAYSSTFPSDGALCGWLPEIQYQGNFALIQNKLNALLERSLIENDNSKIARNYELLAQELDDKDDLAKAQYACQLGTQAASVMTQAVTSVTDSIFSAMNKAQGAKLQAQQQQLDMRKQALESEVQVLSNEYQAVKQGEQSEAKNIAPQFGLA